VNTVLRLNAKTLCIETAGRNFCEPRLNLWSADVSVGLRRCLLDI